MNSTTRVILLLLGSLICASALQYPLKVVYIDQIDCCSPQNTVIEAVNAGFNVVILAFYETGRGVADAALAWSQRMDNQTRINTMKKVHDAGAVVTISLGGANDHDWGKANPVELATTIANFAKDYQLDGVDFDLEVFGGFNAVNGDEQQTIDWFGTLITTTRRILGPNGVISLAPLAPWFGPIGAPKCDQYTPAPGCSWVGPTGGMTQIYKNVGQHIDFFFNQFYNQGACYQTEAGLFMESGPSCTTPGAYYPLTSIKEINAQGVPLNKIVIGKPVDTWAGVGYHDPATLKKWIENSGKALGWNAGVGIWQWWDVLGSQARPFIQTIYPGSGPSTPKPTTQPPATAAPTTKPTTQPTAAPTTRPPTQPTTRPVTPAPTAAPTTPPTQPAYANNIKVALNAASTAWWVGVVVSGGGETTSKIELTDSGSFSSWITLTDQSYAYVFQATSVLKAPLSLRLTSSSGKQVVLTNIFPSFTSSGLIDSGKSYSSASSSTSAPTTKPTSAPATAAPTTKPTSAPATQPPATDSCTDGHMRCASTTTYNSCAHGKWQAAQSCQAGLVCSARAPYIYCV